MKNKEEALWQQLEKKEIQELRRHLTNVQGVLKHLEEQIPSHIVDLVEQGAFEKAQDDIKDLRKVQSFRKQITPYQLKPKTNTPNISYTSLFDVAQELDTPVGSTLLKTLDMINPNDNLVKLYFLDQTYPIASWLEMYVVALSMLINVDNENAQLLYADTDFSGVGNCDFSLLGSDIKGQALKLLECCYYINAELSIEDMIKKLFIALKLYHLASTSIQIEVEEEDAKC